MTWYKFPIELPWKWLLFYHYMIGMNLSLFLAPIATCANLFPIIALFVHVIPEQWIILRLMFPTNWILQIVSWVTFLSIGFTVLGLTIVGQDKIALDIFEIGYLSSDNLTLIIGIFLATNISYKADGYTQKIASSLVIHGVATSLLTPLVIQYTNGLILYLTFNIISGLQQYFVYDYFGNDKIPSTLTNNYSIFTRSVITIVTIIIAIAQVAYIVFFNVSEGSQQHTCESQNYIYGFITMVLSILYSGIIWNKISNSI